MNLRASIDDRGSMSVEMAIFLPLAIIVVVSLLYLIRLAGIHEDVAHIQSEELQRAMAKPEQSLFLSSNLGKITNSELEDDTKSVKTSAKTLYVDIDLKAGRMRDGLLMTEVSYSLLPKFTNIFHLDYKANQKFRVRAFIGRDNASEAMPWSEMEKDDGGGTVWLFPTSGTRYHSEDCTYVKNEPHEEVLSPYLKAKYSSCKKCKSSEMSIGSLAYVFVYGGVYHRSTCVTIDKYIVSMSEEDAKKKNYSPCSKCKGGSQ